MSPTGDSAHPQNTPQARGPLRRYGLRALTALILLVCVTLVANRDQIRSALTHHKGAPTDTEAYAPTPAEARALLRMAVAGDVGEVGAHLDATATRMAEIGMKSPYDVLLLLGDNVYPSGDPARIPETVFGPFGDVLHRGAKLLAVLGNHDALEGNSDAQIQALGMPGHWWSHDFGDVLIVGLDSNETGSNEQLDFLETTLAASTEKWKVVALHHPPYSAGQHGSSEDARRAYSPIFERYGVQLVLSGHDHDYQRSKPIGGVTYVVSGAGSKTRPTGEAAFTAVSWSAYHFLDVTVFRDRLVLRAVMQDGRIGDEATIAP